MNRQFDTLIFAQQWPTTYCRNWMNDGNECKLLPQKGQWTIHGIWPTRFNTNTDKQPSCCDSSIKMNLNELQPIKEQLKRYWPSIQKGIFFQRNYFDQHVKYDYGFLLSVDRSDEGFWEYEWLKHGTCGVGIEEISSSYKYFNKGLNWLREYNMTSILAKSGIIPSNEKSYELVDIQKAVKSVLNKNPSINCYIDRAKNEQYLNEIRICFNQKLEVIDCDGIDKRRNDVVTNCLNKSIHYRADSLDYLSGWFTFFAYSGLVIFIFVVILIRNNNIRNRFYGRSESSRLF